jgi:hypothetical protein
MIRLTMRSSTSIAAPFTACIVRPVAGGVERAAGISRKRLILLAATRAVRRLPDTVRLEDGRWRRRQPVLHPTQWGRRWRREATTEGGRRLEDAAATVERRWWRRRRRRVPRRAPDRGGGRRGMDPGYVVLRCAWTPFRDDEAEGRRDSGGGQGPAGCRWARGWREAWPCRASSGRRCARRSLRASPRPSCRTVHRPGSGQRGPPLRLAALGTSPPLRGVGGRAAALVAVCPPPHEVGAEVASRSDDGGGADAGGRGDDRDDGHDRDDDGDGLSLVVHRIAGTGGEAWIPDTCRLAPLDAAFRDDEAEGRRDGEGGGGAMAKAGGRRGGGGPVGRRAG